MRDSRERAPSVPTRNERARARGLLPCRPEGVGCGACEYRPMHCRQVAPPLPKRPWRSSMPAICSTCGVGSTTRLATRLLRHPREDSRGRGSTGSTRPSRGFATAWPTTCVSHRATNVLASQDGVEKTSLPCSVLRGGRRTRALRAAPLRRGASCRQASRPLALTRTSRPASSWSLAGSCRASRRVRGEKCWCVQTMRGPRRAREHGACVRLRSRANSIER